ncbi:hypothetical protein [Phyllobacterium sp. SB3]|uniref:DUF6985 domain-containing protein n=1 Tax=Phyllobacterium sp. SB3 TaxID=3156073 RepID=UPI0032AF7D41
MEPQIALKPLLTGDPVTLEAFLQSTPLAACDSPSVLAAILPSHPQYNAKPVLGEDVSFVLKVAEPLSEVWFRLPASFDYRSLKILATAPAVIFEIETTGLLVRTNMQELGRNFAPWVERTESERETAFTALANVFEFPKPRPVLQPFMSDVAGEIVPDSSGFWQAAAPLALPLADGEPLPVTMSGITAGDVALIDKALMNFLAMRAEAREDASLHVLSQCREFLNFVGTDGDAERQAMMAISDPAEIWRYVTIEELLVERHDTGDEPVIYIALLCRCAWDEEHGLQLVYRDGLMLTRVSEQDGRMV